MLKRLSFLVSMSFMGVLLILLIVILALATFVESAYDTATAWALVYGTHWFEILLLLIAVNIFGVMYRNRFFNRKKLVVLVFHLAFLLILAGASITRFISYEGTMHIREQGISSSMLSDDAYMHVVLERGGEEAERMKKVMISELTPRDYRMHTRVGGEKVKIHSTGFMPSVMEQWETARGGEPFLQLVLVSDEQRSVSLTPGTETSVPGMSLSLNAADSSAMLRFIARGEELTAVSSLPIQVIQMGGGEGLQYSAGEAVPMQEGMLYKIGQTRMAIRDFLPSARKKLVPTTGGQRGNYLSAVRLEIKYRGMVSEVYIPGHARLEGVPVSGEMGDLAYSITYGARRIPIPFSLFLKDFQVERYPGSNSPSSFASEVVLVDRELGVQEDRRIFMNNVLKHRGYRFYQSSYDNDEMGTILSVNRDRTGTFVTYMGYVVLFAGMILAMFVKGTRFAMIAKRTASKAGILVLGLLLLGTGSNAFSQSVPPKDVAEEFGQLWVQDKGGRFEPVNTLASEVVRKITKKNRYKDYTSNQVLLGMILYPGEWQAEPLFKIKNPELHHILGYKGERVSFNDLLDTSGTNYLLSDLVSEAYSKPVASQTDLDKEVIKLDDRVNALFLVQSGSMLTIFPGADPATHKWASVSDALQEHMGPMQDSLGMLFLHYLGDLRQGEYGTAQSKLRSMHDHQLQNETLLPSRFVKRLEIFYNQVNIFPKLTRIYILVGILLMVLQFLIVFRSSRLVRILFKVGTILMAASLVLHTLALAVRWYISGHAPMSNGYESMIFVSWVTLLAGLIFVKRSGYALALTSILSALALMVAGMSNMNPEITNLVPVLKSVWLTIHVTVIMAGYGFLGMASVMGLMSVILYASLSPGNKVRLAEVIRQLTNVNHMTLIIGLYFMTAGMFLGGVWANESWGRYWGWDPKETWALITVLVYAFVTHMHRIPGMRGNFAFNLASFIGYASVMMTYFGVNYFLGGIHSYASGSAFQVPYAVYVAMVLLVALSIFAYRRQQKLLPEEDQ
jgi:cytochrome c-type biogenesis protein CcsB